MRLPAAMLLAALLCGCETYEQLPPDKQQALLSKASGTCQEFGYRSGTQAHKKCVAHAILRYDQGVIDRWN